MPLITVLMPVFNAGSFLKQSIDSILSQTYSNFDFLIVDDGSTDIETRNLLQKALSDRRLKLVTHASRLGVSRSLNHGLELATGEYIARMDADDVSHPLRLEKQLQFMNKNSDVGVCGTAIECFGNAIQEFTITNPQDSEEIKCRLLLSCPISHPTVMFRRESFQRCRLSYNEEFETAQDYELWTRCAHLFRMANLQEPLHYYRVHDKQNQRSTARGTFIKRIIKSQWEDLGLSYSEEDLQSFYEVAHCASTKTSPALDGALGCVEAIFTRILSANEAQRRYDSLVLKKVFTRFWMTTLAGEKRYSWSLWNRYKKHAYAQPALSDMLRLFVKCLLRWKARDPRHLIF
jgi:glycosyltransferase involved in cell wall biosynthesis